MNVAGRSKSGYGPEQIRLPNEVPPTLVAVAVHARVGMEDSFARVFANLLQAMAVGLAPTAVVDQIAAGHADDAAGDGREPQRVGQGRVGTEAVAGTRQVCAPWARRTASASSSRTSSE